MIYQLEYTERARKDLKKLERETARRIIRALHTIREDPYHHLKKLKGTRPEHPVYTYRIGLYYRFRGLSHGGSHNGGGETPLSVLRMKESFTSAKKNGCM